MTLRIQCPSCQRQFKVNDDLKGRTVECGACEHQFSVEDEVVVRGKEKFYPGEGRRPGLEGFGRSTSAAGAEVQFETATYSEQASAADVSPVSPQQTVAAGLGVVVQVVFAIFLVVGVQTGLFFKDVELGKRIVLAAFVVAVGTALILYASLHRKKSGILTSLTLGALVMTLAVFLPVPSTAPDAANKSDATRTRALEEREEDAPLTATEAIEAVGYSPVLAAIERNSTEGGVTESVIALWAPNMEERFKYQIQKFLHRKAGTPERPSFYRRGKGGLFVLEGTSLGFPEVAALVERFGSVDDEFPEIRLMMISVEGEQLLDASAELMGKLKDKTHPAFYIRNKAELSHIDIDRVRDAAQRLAGAEPKRFRTEIAELLVDLLDESDDPKFRDTICRAIGVWSQPGDGAEKVLARAAREFLLKEEPLPRSMIEFLLVRKSPEAIPLTELLWSKDPSTWEPIMASAGSDAEVVIAPHLKDDDRAVRLSAARLLRRVGSSNSLEALRTALADFDGDEDMRTVLLSAIERIERVESDS